MTNIKISIIIVHYNNKKDLLECLDSFYRLKIKLSYEIIIVDNSENKDIKQKLSQKYNNLKYISSKKNIGYGAGMNLGASFAKGEYLFILNPDVIFSDDIITTLVSKIEGNKKIGVIAPLLYTEKDEIMQQGAKILTPLKAIFKFSFIDKLFPNNKVSRNYWANGWSKKKLKEVDVVPGTAFVVRKKLFDKIGGFDEKFFLYFEEFDFCKRIREKGFINFIDPTSKLIHKWGTTTKLLSNKDEIFRKSRFYYFKKNFGTIKALLVEFFLNLNKDNIFLFLILVTSITVRIYKLNIFAPFIGDQGWFFISARDAIINHSIPLVGITSSHLWLHQGPLWTYIVSILFLVFKFSPFAPFYFTAVLDSLTVYLIYLFCKNTFSIKIATLASILYAFSPFVILSSRTAYHTSPIPFFVILLFFSTYKWIKGNNLYFPLTILILFILYNFELQNSVFILMTFLILMYGYFKKKVWFTNLLNIKILFYSVIAFVIPMLPILIYDYNNGFVQTIVFAGWMGYKGFSFISHLVSGSGGVSIAQYISFSTYFNNFLSKLIFYQSLVFSLIVFLISFIYLLIINIKKLLFKNVEVNIALLLLFVLFPFLGILISKTPSDAYLISSFVPIVIMIAYFLNAISKNKIFKIVVILVILAISFLNVNQLIKDNYLSGSEEKFGPNLVERINASKYMIKNSGVKSFTVFGMGQGSEFESFTMNYQYLTWYYGKEYKKRGGEIVYLIWEYPNGVKIKQFK